MRLFRKILKAAKVYEQHLQDQKSVSKQFLSLRNILTFSIDKPLPVEFFFYSNKEDDAQLLSADLQKEGYEVYGVE